MSKSFDIKQTAAEKPKRRKSLDFAALYKTEDETAAIIVGREKRRDSVGAATISSIIKNREETPKQNKSSTKKKNKNRNTSLDTSQIDGPDLNVSNNDKVTSTPYAKGTSKTKDRLSVKSIIKNSSALDNSETVYTPRTKKRNKSVSFMLDDNEETAVKKIKSNENSPSDASSIKAKNLKKEKNRKKRDVEKENNETNVQENGGEIKTSLTNKKTKTNYAIVAEMDTESSFAPNDSMENNLEAKKKFRKNKKHKKPKSVESIENLENIYKNENKEKRLKKKNRQLKQTEYLDTTESVETNMESQSAPTLEHPEVSQNDNNNYKEKKAKKQKRHHKQSDNIEKVSADANAEPKEKSRKKELKPVPELIVEDLENLKIGDNPHKLTHLLDEMTVVDKNKKQKSKGKIKTGKDKESKTSSSASIESTDLEKIDEEKEKVVWKKRKWNKDKKVDTDSILTSVIVENLPLKIIFDYRKILNEHFSKLGLIKNIGIAEVYPNEEPKPVFTSTVQFYSEGAAIQALEEDNTRFEGSRLRVKRPLLPSETTLVVKSYGELSEQALSSLFLGAGRVRSIRCAIKGRKSMSTVFVEFDGPESVERAISLAQHVKIGFKRIYVAKFETRQAKKPALTPEVGGGD